MGLGVPKALATLGGITLLERAARILAHVCDEIVVSAPAALPLTLPVLPPSARGATALRRVDDPAGRSGPLAGVVAGLAATGYQRALVLAVDLPLADPAALDDLQGRLGDRQAVVPFTAGVPQPLAAAYAPGAGAVLAARLKAGERALLVAVESLDALWVREAELALLPGGLEGFFNVNTRADLAEAERRLAAREATR